MAMSLPIAIPSTPSAGNSPASDESSNLPRTPVSPSNMQALPDQSSNNGNNQVPQQNTGVSQMKRKPSRRANTAERRATHNAVERQRRETLNGRFLDLAALLPNLSQIRRPSKSSIVNSSIAHIHASRRHRLLASRELRLIKLEADALRRELNEWRDRAALPRVEEPVRGEGFAMVLSGEIEVLAAVVDDEEGGEGYDGYEDGDEFAGVAGSAPVPADDSEDVRLTQSAVAAQMLKNANPNPFAHNLPPSAGSNGSSNNNNGMHITHIMPRPSQHGGPMIASSPTAVSFENPAMAALYEPNQGPFSAQYLQQSLGQPDSDKWNAQLFNPALGGPQLQQLQAQHGLFTPPGSALSATPSSASTNAPGNPFNDQEFFANFQRQQQMVAMHQQHGNMGHMYGSPTDGDDSSSVGSASSRRRERSGSLNSGSGYGSPQHGSPMGNYEISGAGAEAQSDYGMPKRFTAGLHINTSVNGPWGGGRGNTAVDGMNGMMKQNLTPPISVGGGGNGSGFAMMRM